MSDDKQFEGRVIVTYGRSLMALVIAHSLGKRGIEVIGCDDVDYTVLSFSRYVRENFVHAAYSEDPDQYFDDLEENIRRLKPDDDRPYVLIPAFRDARLLAEHRDRFDGLITLAAPPLEAIERIDPKDKLFRTAEKLGVRIPETHQPANRDELQDLANDLSFPRIIKPVDGVGGRGITCAENAEELLAAYDKLMKRETTQPLLQEVVDGEDYCLTVLYHEGELVAHSAYTNIANMPVEGGSGAVRETVDDGKFMEVAEKLFGPLGWSGVAEIDFRWDGDPDSDAYLIEVNPRFWAGLFQSVESGVDFPWLLYQLYTTGQVDAEPVAKIGTKTKVPAIWLAAAIRDSFDDALHLDESRKMLAIAGRHFRRGHFLRGFDWLRHAFTDAVDLDTALFEVKDTASEAADARHELDFDDDPMIAMGALFVIGSLKRHGRLPPELTG